MTQPADDQPSPLTPRRVFNVTEADLAQLEQIREARFTGRGLVVAASTTREKFIFDETQKIIARREANRRADLAEAGLTAGAELCDLMVDGGSFINDIAEGIPAVWGNGMDVLWAEGEALIIVGPPGVGKTTISHQVAAAMVGGGGKVLGFEVAGLKDGQRLLVLACDRPKQIARAMRRQFRHLDRDLVAAKVVVWKGPPPGDFAKDPELLTRLCEAAGATHVLIDSLKDVAIGLSDDQVGAAVNISRQRALAAGVEVMELHHLVKRGENGSKPTKLADVYGSIWITGGAGSVLLVWGEAGDLVVEVLHLKQPGNDVGPLEVVHDHALGRSDVSEDLDIATLAGQFVGGMSATAFAARLFGIERPDKNEVQKARRRLERATKDGLLVVVAEGVKGGDQTNKNMTRWGPAAPDVFRQMGPRRAQQAQTDPVS